MVIVPSIDAAAPPKARQAAKTVEAHGDKRIDPYHWLREKSNPEVIRYLEEENAYTAARMAQAKELEEKLYQEIVGRIQQTDLSVPVRRGEYLYYTRTETGKQYPVWCRRQGEEGAEQVLLDGNAMAQAFEYFMVGAVAPSPDQELLAYAVDTIGGEEMTIRVKDLESGALLEDRIEKAASTLVWAEDGRTLFYTVLNPARRPYKLMRHRLGTPAGEDSLVWHETDERFNVNVSKTRSREWLLLTMDSQTTSEIRYLRAPEPQGEWKTLVPRVQDVEAAAAHHGEWFYIRISDTSKTFRLVRAPVAGPSRDKWEDLLPARADVTLENVDAYKDHLTVVERDKGLRKIRVRRFSTGEEHFVSMPEASYALWVGGDVEFDSTVRRFTYSSLVTPPSVYDYDMATRQRVLRKQQPVLGGYDPSQYVTERIEATALDGVKVPVSLVYRKGLRRDGSAPALLYGYGAYGIPSDASFSSDRISLLDRGFVYAIAHIRGGGDLGKPWHEAGRMLNKQNSFADFIACAEALIAEKYTSPTKLAILGGSAGGLLMGAVVNQRPDLFGAVVAKVPFVDVLNTMEDATLPLTVTEYEEWGNPAEEKYYRNIRGYSPYDNVEKQQYPHLLATAGLNDPRVSYWEPAKWVARLRSMKKGNSLLLLKTNMGAGHFGASGRYERWRETAFDYAFLLTALGVE